MRDRYYYWLFLLSHHYVPRSLNTDIFNDIATLITKKILGTRIYNMQHLTANVCSYEENACEKKETFNEFQVQVQLLLRQAQQQSLKIP